jgi:hypothetical protein
MTRAGFGQTPGCAAPGSLRNQIVIDFAARPGRKPIVLGLRSRFGRYPVLFIYLYAEMFIDPKKDRKIVSQFRLALQDDYVSGELLSHIDGEQVVSKLLDAARDLFQSAPP